MRLINEQYAINELGLAKPNDIWVQDSKNPALVQLSIPTQYPNTAPRSEQNYQSLFMTLSDFLSMAPKEGAELVFAATMAGFPNPGNTTKMYVAEDTNYVYRWDGMTYVEISAEPPTPTLADVMTEGPTGRRVDATGTIQTSGGDESISVNDKLLTKNNGVPVYAWDTNIIYGTQGKSVNFEDRILFNTDGSNEMATWGLISQGNGYTGLSMQGLLDTTANRYTVVDSNNRRLLDENEILAVEFLNDNRILYTTGEFISVNWETRELSNGNFSTLNWIDKRTYDGNGNLPNNTSSNWASRRLFDSFNGDTGLDLGMAIDWDNRQAYDRNGGLSIGWDASSLIGRRLYDDGGSETINWHTKDLTGANCGGSTLSWDVVSNRNTYGVTTPFIISTNDNEESINPNSRSLWHSTQGVATLNWETCILQDNTGNGFPMVSWSVDSNSDKFVQTRLPSVAIDDAETAEDTVTMYKIEDGGGTGTGTVYLKFLDNDTMTYKTIELPYS